jgi:GDP-4-dehydro-6-deoxy-D-mannose reductase
MECVEIKALITGMTGFIGSHLAEFLLSKDMDVVGTVWDETELKNVEAVKDKVRILNCDIRDEERVLQIISDEKPDRIFHLAAQSFPTVSWDEPTRTLDTNVLGTSHIFEAVRKSKIDPIVLVACSSAEYGFVSESEVPVSEDHVLLPLHPYGVSKVAQDLLAYQYYQNFALKTVRARIFNTTGPRKTNDVCSDFTNRIVKIEKGKEKEMLVGNLEPKRDITDVADVVNALWLLTEKGKMGEAYNVCSSRAYRIKDILKMAISLSSVDIKFKQDPNKLRPTDEPIIMGDNTEIKEDCGWVPKMQMEETLDRMLDYWRKEIP